MRHVSERTLGARRSLLSVRTGGRHGMPTLHENHQGRGEDATREAFSPSISSRRVLSSNDVAICGDPLRRRFLPQAKGEGRRGSDHAQDVEIRRSGYCHCRTTTNVLTSPAGRRRGSARPARLRSPDPKTKQHRAPGYFGATTPGFRRLPRPQRRRACGTIRPRAGTARDERPRSRGMA